MLAAITGASSVVGCSDAAAPELVTTAAAAIEVSLPPAPPETLAFPSAPTAVGTSVGYLPDSWEVTSAGKLAYSISLDVPAGRAGMQPRLSLAYSSGAGSGILGVGWSVSGMSAITRCGKSLSSEGIVDNVDYSDFATDPENSRDRFCLDGQKMVAIRGKYGENGTEYRTEHETYARILSHMPDGAGSLGPESFSVATRDGLIRTYQATTIPRVSASSSGMIAAGVVRDRWLLQSETDRAGNGIIYTYTTINDGHSGVQHLPKRIEYTTFKDDPRTYRYVQFDYEDRGDVEFSWQSGTRTSLQKRLKSITMHAPSPTATEAVWTYNLAYATSRHSNRSLLPSVQKCALHGKKTGGCLWKKQFD